MTKQILRIRLLKTIALQILLEICKRLCRTTEEHDLINLDPQNFVPDCIDEVELSYDEFDGFEKRIKKFDQDLKIYEQNSKDSFLYSAFCGIHYSMLEEKEKLNFARMKKNLWKFLGETKAKKEQLHLDLSLSTFEIICHVVKDLLMTKSSFCMCTSFGKSFDIS